MCEDQDRVLRLRQSVTIVTECWRSRQCWGFIAAKFIVETVPDWLTNLYLCVCGVTSVSVWCQVLCLSVVWVLCLPVVCEFCFHVWMFVSVCISVSICVSVYCNVCTSVYFIYCVYIPCSYYCLPPNESDTHNAEYINNVWMIVAGRVNVSICDLTEKKFVHLHIYFAANLAPSFNIVLLYEQTDTVSSSSKLTSTYKV